MVTSRQSIFFDGFPVKSGTLTVENFPEGIFLYIPGRKAEIVRTETHLTVMADMDAIPWGMTGRNFIHQRIAVRGKTDGNGIGSLPDDRNFFFQFGKVGGIVFAVPCGKFRIILLPCFTAVRAVR